MTLWYLIRAFGLVALLALTASTALGALSTVGSADGRLVRQLVHRSVAVLGLVALGVHLTLVVADTFVSVPLRAVLVPLASSYRPVAVGLGTLALYAFLLAAVSGLVRGRLPAPSARPWRVLHAVAYLGWALSMLHGITAGTDTRTPWALAVYAACGLAVASALLLRAGARARRAADHHGHLRLTTGGSR